MTERDDTEDTRAPQPDAPAVSSAEGADAVAEGAAEAVDPAPAEVSVPAPPLDTGAATPDRSGPAGAADERPELFVAGAFVGGLVLAVILRQVSGD